MGVSFSFSWYHPIVFSATIFPFFFVFFWCCFASSHPLASHQLQLLHLLFFFSLSLLLFPFPAYILFAIPSVSRGVGSRVYRIKCLVWEKATRSGRPGLSVACFAAHHLILCCLPPVCVCSPRLRPYSYYTRDIVSCFDSVLFLLLVFVFRRRYIVFLDSFHVTRRILIGCSLINQ